MNSFAILVSHSSFISVGKAREYLSVLNLTLPDIGEQTIILNNVRASSDIVVSSCEYFCMIRCRGTPVDAKVYTIQPQQLALSTMNPNDVPFTIDPKVVIVEVQKIHHTFTFTLKIIFLHTINQYLFNKEIKSTQNLNSQPPKYH